jgi:uncharacterized protein
MLLQHSPGMIRRTARSHCASLARRVAGVIPLKRASILLLFLVVPALHATSFDCKKARTNVEHAICSSAELSKADDELATAYHAAMEQIPPGAKPDFVAGQRAWLHAIAIRCQGKNGSEGMQNCLLEFYRERTDALKNLVAQHNGITFVWQSVAFALPAKPSASGDPHYSSVDPSFESPSILLASWPQAKSDAPEWKAWNKGVEDAARGLARQKGDKWSAVADMDNDVTTFIDFVDDHFVSATIISTWYGQGAHGNVNSRQLTWLLKKQRELRPQDVFREDLTWKDLVVTKTIEELEKQYKDDAGDLSDLPQRVASGELHNDLQSAVAFPSNWVVEDDGLSIVFQQGFFCHACYVNPVKIHWADIKPILNPSFVPPGGRATAPVRGFSGQEPGP